MRMCAVCMVMFASLVEQSVTVGFGSVENFEHDDVDDESETGSEDHDEGFLNDLFFDDAFGGFGDDEEEQDVDDEEVGEGP